MEEANNQINCLLSIMYRQVLVVKIIRLVVELGLDLL